MESPRSLPYLPSGPLSASRYANAIHGARTATTYLNVSKDMNDMIAGVDFSGLEKAVKVICAEVYRLRKELKLEYARGFEDGLRVANNQNTQIQQVIGKIWSGNTL